METHRTTKRRPHSSGRSRFACNIVQTCIIHLIRGKFRYAGRQHRDAIAKAIKPIYTAVNATAAAEALEAFDAEWGHHYPAAIRLWRTAWEEFIPSWTTAARQASPSDGRLRGGRGPAAGLIPARRR